MDIPDAPHRPAYDSALATIQSAFAATAQTLPAGPTAVHARAAAVDTLIQTLAAPILPPGVALLAVGGYGRRELFPFSDVDLMFLLDPRTPERAVKDPIRRLNQLLWDCGLRASAMTRTLPECERFDPENVEFTLSLLDARPLAGDPTLATRLLEVTVPKVIARDHKKIIARLLEVTRLRHARYGDTLFHLEPNIKECPGGLRDAHVAAWLTRLSQAPAPGAAPTPTPSPDFLEARAFLTLTRVFLHFRHHRDDNTLDWQAQDAAAAAHLGSPATNANPAYWMRLYFRHARAIARNLAQSIEVSTPTKPASRLPRLLRPSLTPTHAAYKITANRIAFKQASPDPAHDPEAVLSVFAALARTGAPLARLTETRIEDALPRLSANLEDGPALWHGLAAILTGPFAGRALRAMHTLGVLELLIPEFHGIDALVIRDAYHRYTVDEHTFVLIDTLHALTTPSATPPSVPWAPRFAAILRDLPHPALLFLAALLHDTGKGHASADHAIESVRMATDVVARLDLDAYESGLVLDLIRNHLEMSAALRRDVFDSETIRAFAARVQTPEALRMLTLFTYADISAVHPDALTPWKAENLWRLHIATANFLDRHVDDERVASAAESELSEIVHRIEALGTGSLAARKAESAHFLEGLPRRYLHTRTPEAIRAHIDMAAHLPADPIQLDFRFAPTASELTLVTRDRPMLFASVAGALAGWGMNILTADAFSNANGVVVDSFRFTDTFRTLELNDSERVRFLASIREVIAGATEVESLLAPRRRARKKAIKVPVETRIDFDNAASTQSTLLQVVAQDTPGLLRALSLPIARSGHNVEVALVDTEGEMAIDVFYLTAAGQKLTPTQQDSLRTALTEAITANAS